MNNINTYKPLVSIIIPVYNGSNYLSEAIESALSQTYKNIEIIVVNDGSNDDGATEKIALSYGDKIKYIWKENGGSSSALNIGIENMTGEYFSWLSHDDLYTSKKIEKSVEKIQFDISERQIIICGSDLIDESGNKIFHPKRELDGDFTSTQILKKLIANYGINGCSVLIPKSVIDRVGFFNEQFIYVNDVDYWYRIILNDCVFTCFTDKLVKNRIHNEQVSVKKANLLQVESEILFKRFFELLFDDLDKNIKKIVILIKTCSRVGKFDIVKNILKKLKLNNKLKLYWIPVFFFYMCWGKCIKIIKKIYKFIFIKR